MYEIKLVDASLASISHHHELLQVVFPSALHITPQYLNWEYNQNPAGKVAGFNAYMSQIPLGSGGR